MAIKHHKVPSTFNATPKRVRILAKYICDHLKAEQARCQAQKTYFVIRPEYIEDALESFTAPGSHALYAGTKAHPDSLFSKKK